VTNTQAWIICAELLIVALYCFKGLIR